MLHAIARAKERWGLEITIEALDAINRTFSSKNFVPVGRTPRNGVRRIVCFLFYADEKMPVVWDATSKTIATFLPMTALGEIEQLLSERREEHKRLQRTRNKITQVLKRPHWMSEEDFQTRAGTKSKAPSLTPQEEKMDIKVSLDRWTSID